MVGTTFRRLTVKIILGLDEAGAKVGTIEVGPDGKFVFGPESPDIDLSTLRRAAEDGAWQLGNSEAMTEEKGESLTAKDGLKWMLERMQARHFWAEPAYEEAARSCVRPIWKGNSQADASQVG